MGKNDRIHVFLRVRPNRDRGGASDQGYVIDHTFDRSVVQFHVDRKNTGAIDDYINHSVEDYRFEFDRVFGPKTNQEEMFNMVAKDCVLSAMDGYNSTIFAYGQTGSGKTYSITGGTESYNDRGIIPRCLSLVFDEAAKRTEEQFTIRISYLQIYNDKGQDLLNRGKDAKTLDELPTVSVHETEEEVILRGLEAHPTANIHEALNLLFLGDTNRLYCETPMNKTSSRSHCIFTVSIEARAHGSATVRRSKLNLVDLAGSERVGKTGVQGNLLTEAKYINLSLHFLEHVIVALSEQAKGRRDHVPYRNSFMTMCLRDSIGGNCRTAMLATAHPAPEFFMETISTCKFAQRVACIRQDARINEETDPTILVRKLKHEVAQLKEQLSFYTKGDQDANRELSADEYERCREVIQRFLDDADPKVNITGVNGDLPRLLACFRILKSMVKGGAVVPGASAAPSSAAGANRGPGSSATPAQQQAHPTADASKLKAHVDALTMSLQQKENEISLLFNIVEKASAPKFNATTQTGDHAHDNRFNNTNNAPSQPSSSLQPSSGGITEQRPFGLGALLGGAQQQQQQPLVEEEPPESAAEAQAEKDRLDGAYDLTVLADADLLKDRQAAFEAFRRSYRKYDQIEKNKADLKGRYDMCKQIAGEVNQCVDAIKKIKHQVNQLRAERALHNTEDPSPHEQQLTATLESAKAAYQRKGKELGTHKEYIDQMHLVMMRAQEQLTKDFEAWFALRQRQLYQAQKQQAKQDRLQQRGGGGASSSSSAFMSIPTHTLGGGVGVGSGAGTAQPQPLQRSDALYTQQQQLTSMPGQHQQPQFARHHSSSSMSMLQGGGQTAAAGSSSASSFLPPVHQPHPSSAPASSDHQRPVPGLGGGGAGGGVAFPPLPAHGGSGSSSGVAGFNHYQGRAPSGHYGDGRGPAIPAPANPQSSLMFGGAQSGPSAYRTPPPNAAQSNNTGLNTSTATINSSGQQQSYPSQTPAPYPPYPSGSGSYTTSGGGYPPPPPSGSNVGTAFGTPLPGGSSGGRHNSVGGGAMMSNSGSSAAFQSNLRAGVLSEHQRHQQQLAEVSAQVMNPYYPLYPSTGDAEADAQLAAMYKARDDMRARLQQQK